MVFLPLLSGLTSELRGKRKQKESHPAEVFGLLLRQCLRGTPVSSEDLPAMAVPAGCGMQAGNHRFYRESPGNLCGRVTAYGGRDSGLKAPFMKGLDTRRSPPEAQPKETEGGDPG